jgi:hypothetical protein
MAANPSFLGALPYADEASWGDSSTVTFDERIPIANSVNEMIAGLQQSKINVDHTVQYLNDGRHEVRGAYGGSFPIRCYLAGHGSTCAGAISATDVPTFLGRVIGNSDATQVGTTVDTPTDADTFSLVGGTIADGSLIRVGSIDDGRGNGQFQAVKTAATCQLFTACDAAPNAGDVVYGCEHVYPSEDASGYDVTSMRFNLQTANQRLNAWGCFPQGFSVSGFNAGEIPECTVDMGVSQWGFESASTYPTATAVDDFVPAKVAAGSMYVQEMTTTTRALETVRDVQFNVDLQVIPLYGPGSDNADTIIIGARRVKSQATISFTVDAEAAGTQTWSDAWAATTPVYYHILYTLSATDGSAMGIYMPKCKLIGQRPTQIDHNGLNRVRVEFLALTESVTTTPTDLEQSSWRMGFG